MTRTHFARGGAAVGVLNQLDAWEANLILNLRLWCDGPKGRDQVWTEYRDHYPGAEAQQEFKAFERLINTVVECAHRPLVRHHVGCSCVGADEHVFLNLVHAASDGNLADAALVATLISGPAHAERIAILAGQVGEAVRKIHSTAPAPMPATASNVVRLH